jgi:hypothetical protein
VTLSLRGHLFDTGLINQVLDLVESRGGSFHIVECITKPNRGHVKNKTAMVLEVEAQSPSVLADIVARVEKLVSAIEVRLTRQGWELCLSLIASDLVPHTEAVHQQRRRNRDKRKGAGECLLSRVPEPLL